LTVFSLPILAEDRWPLPFPFSFYNWLCSTSSL
jgi:hypothetical protein